MESSGYETEHALTLLIWALATVVFLCSSSLWELRELRPRAEKHGRRPGRSLYLIIAIGLGVYLKKLRQYVSSALS
jgi:hypothetical protein